MRRLHPPRLLMALGLSFALTACGDKDPTEPANEDDRDPFEEQDPFADWKGPIFTVSPLPIHTYNEISPVGSNNKIFPVGHTYWGTCDAGLARRDPPPKQEDIPNCRLLEKQVLLAPGPGIAVFVHSAEDGSVRVSGPGGYDWQLGHVTPLVAKGDTITAGQPVAKMHYEFGFDFGLWQMKDSLTEGVANPERFPHFPPVHPISLYGDSLRAELIKFVPTVEGEILGKAHWDIPGTAMGAWFLEGAPAGNLLGPESSHYTLFLGRFTLRQSVRLIAVGGMWPGMHNSTFALDPAALDWEKVTPATGRIAQKAWYSSLMGEFTYDWPGGGTFLIEMLAEDRLRLEWFDTHEPVTEFTAAARVYVR